MLSEKELSMYQAQRMNVNVVCKDGDVLSGHCSEFSSAYDNDGEGASITLENGMRKSTGEKLYPLTEVFENEIEKIEYKD